jgi:hypothetical protein
METIGPRRRLRHLILAWLAYWALLALITLGPAGLAIYRAVTGPDSENSISAGFGDSRMNLTVVEEGTTTWSGSTDLLTLALLIAGPPVLILLGWLLWSGRERREPLGSNVLRS